MFDDDFISKSLKGVNISFSSIYLLGNNPCKCLILKTVKLNDSRALYKDIQCESKKVAPLKLFAIFSLRLSIFP